MRCNLLLGMICAGVMTTEMNAAELLPPLAKYVEARIAEFDEITAERREVLLKIAVYVRTQRAAAAPARMTYICTANSRRSQFGQAWAAVAAARYGVEEVESFSGGTEASAFNPRTIAALERAGVSIKGAVVAAATPNNPRYTVRFAEKQEPIIFFSKRFDEQPNPRDGFCAVMVCSEADESCPHVPGASVRVSLPYVDPKAADGTADEAQAYDERCAQIAREMLFVFSRTRESSRMR